METRYKYPRTTHLPWSRARASDDLVRSTSSTLYPVETEILITEKLDGENTTLYRDGLHARSVDSRHHPSRDWVKGMRGHLRHQLPEGMRICGENLYARHSIPYENLKSYFFVFSVWEGSTCLAWDDTVEWIELLGLQHVPILYRGVWDERIAINLSEAINLERTEGFVVRPVRSFQFDQFSHVVNKWVRPNHVQTDEHWMHGPIIPNHLAE